MLEGRVYKTGSGSYSERELAVVVWLNPDRAIKPRSRLLETLTSRYSNNPMAFPIKSLQNKLPEAPLATRESLSDEIIRSDKSHPVLIPIPVARKELGWTDFYVPSEYAE